MPAFSPAGSSGANSCTERVKVLKNFKPMLPMAGQSKGSGAKGKGNSLGGAQGSSAKVKERLRRCIDE
jgi:hypothetical protein